MSVNGPTSAQSAETVPILGATLYGELQRRIVTGVYPPGSWIREAELQREFGLSNGPVREALQLALGDGLVERAAFRGVRVVQLDEREIADLFEVREALFGFAAERAARRVTPEARRSAAALKASIRREMDRSVRDRLLLRGELSRWVFGLAGNPSLAEAYRRPLLQSLIYLNAAIKRTPASEEFRALVEALIDAIVAGKPAQARAAVRRLTRKTTRELGLHSRRPSDQGEPR